MLKLLCLHPSGCRKKTTATYVQHMNLMLNCEINLSFTDILILHYNLRGVVFFYQPLVLLLAAMLLVLSNRIPVERNSYI